MASIMGRKLSNIFVTDQLNILEPALMIKSDYKDSSCISYVRRLSLHSVKSTTLGDYETTRIGIPHSIIKDSLEKLANMLPG